MRDILLAIERIVGFGAGGDGKWNTSNDHILRSFSVAVKGGGLSFGYGLCGPIPGLAESVDGGTFQVNGSMAFNQDMTSNAGTVYLVNGQKCAMALTANSSDCWLCVTSIC